MTLGNYTPFRAKHIEGVKFGDTAWSTADMDSTSIALDTSFMTNNASPLLDIVGSPDTNNPTQSYAFAKDFSTSGNERSINEDPLLGADSTGTQNKEISTADNSNIKVSFTCVYRNPMPLAIFNDSTKACLIEMDNSESATTGVVNMVFNNIIMTKVGDLQRNSDGLMEQKIEFTARGGTSGSPITVTQSSPSESWVRYRAGLDYAEEVRTA